MKKRKKQTINEQENSDYKRLNQYDYELSASNNQRTQYHTHIIT